MTDNDADYRLGYRDGQRDLKGEIDRLTESATNANAYAERQTDLAFQTRERLAEAIADIDRLEEVVNHHGLQMLVNQNDDISHLVKHTEKVEAEHDRVLANWSKEREALCTAAEARIAKLTTERDEAVEIAHAVEVLKVENKQLQNANTEAGAIIEAIETILAGAKVSDFELSFPVVRAVADLWRNNG